MKNQPNTPKWMRSRYQLKKHIRKRIIREATAKHLEWLIEQEIKIIFGDSKMMGKPTGILNYKDWEQ